MNLEERIEGVLFYKAEPMKKTALAGFFKVDPEALDEALLSLSERLRGPIRLAMTDDTVQLVTAPEMSGTIESLRKEDERRDIGKAGAETLAIIVYRGPLSRSEIDRIRGVNSNFILRNLLIRGLIERRPHPTDQRSYFYAATPALMNHLGIMRRDEMPEFADIMNALDAYETEARKSDIESEQSIA